MFLYPGWHWLFRLDHTIWHWLCLLAWSIQLSLTFELLHVHIMRHAVKLSGFPSASTTTRAWRKLWPPTSPSHRYHWGRWVPCPLRYPAPPIQVEVNPQVRVLTRGLAREEPQGSSQHQRPPALRSQLPASRHCCLRKTKTLRWRLKWRAVTSVS